MDDYISKIIRMHSSEFRVKKMDNYASGFISWKMRMHCSEFRIKKTYGSSLKFITEKWCFILINLELNRWIVIDLNLLELMYIFY